MTDHRTIMPPAFSWDSQACQYAHRGQPGIALECHSIGEFPAITVIQCLLYRDDAGLLIGILNRYDGRNPLEREGSINLWVRPTHQRQGIATALLADAHARWGIDLAAQRFTSDGVRLLDGLRGKGVVP